MSAGALIIAWSYGKASGLPWWVWAAVIVECALATPGIILMCIKAAKAIFA